MEEMFDPKGPSQGFVDVDSVLVPPAASPTRVDPMAFGGDEVDIELVKKKQESDMERENAIRTKAAKELEEKQARIKKGEQQLKDALKYGKSPKN